MIHTSPLPPVTIPEVPLTDYPYLHATRADLLRRLGRREEAAWAYRRALDLTANAAERDFLEGRIGEVENPIG